MNRGVLHQSSPVQQLMAAGGPNWWNINNNIKMRPSPPPPNNLFPQNPSPPSSSSWHHDNQELPGSWTQLLVGGLEAEADKSSSSSGLSHIHQQAKKLEIWEEQVDHHETSPPNISYHHHHHVYGNINNNTIQAAAANPWSHQMMPVSSPKSCVTSLNTSSNMLDFSSGKPDGRHPPPDRSSEYNSTATGGAAKKARVESSSSTQSSTFKVRKEKLGDRITALHQIVSPFGKTDTASVLFEVIEYIKFLQGQIEVLSLPYLGSGSENNMRRQQSVEGERNCLFPEDPGQLLNDNCTKRKVATEQEPLEEAKDLRSRGLCLLPISCTLQVGSETNGADYWAAAAL